MRSPDWQGVRWEMANEDYWLDYQCFLEVKHGNARLAGRDLRTSRLFDVFGSAAVKLERAFAGRRWLRGRFDDDVDVVILSRLAESASPAVARVWLGSPRGVPAACCDLDVPAAWFRDREDGLTGLRLIEAGLVALRRVGQEFALGEIPLRGRQQDRGRPPNYDVFGPPPARLAGAERAVSEAVSALEPGWGVLCARRDAVDPAWVAAAVRAFRAAKAGAEAEAEMEVRMWHVPPFG